MKEWPDVGFTTAPLARIPRPAARDKLQGVALNSVLVSMTILSLSQRPSDIITFTLTPKAVLSGEHKWGLGVLGHLTIFYSSHPF